MFEVAEIEGAARGNSLQSRNLTAEKISAERCNTAKERGAMASVSESAKRGFRTDAGTDTYRGLGCHNGVA
jgi:hypothetical protein